MRKNYPMEHVTTSPGVYPYQIWHELAQGKQLPVSLHYSLFSCIFFVCADEDQKKEWGPKISNNKILGCYA